MSLPEGLLLPLSVPGSPWRSSRQTLPTSDPSAPSLDNGKSDVGQCVCGLEASSPRTRTTPKTRVPSGMQQSPHTDSLSLRCRSGA